MALILPFLLVLVIGIVELGIALNRQLTVVNAAREGARFGATGVSMPKPTSSVTTLRCGRRKSTGRATSLT